MTLSARLVILITATLAACASPPERLYTLQPKNGDMKTASVSLPIVEIRLLGIPVLHDRPQIVVSEGEYRVRANEQERWAVPLKIALPRLFAGELNQRVANRRFVVTPSLMSEFPAGRLDIDISHLDISAADGVAIQASWVYRSTLPEKVIAEGDIASHAAAVIAGYQGYVEALRRAAVDLADQLSKKPGVLQDGNGS
jgi:uncharacterized lipoprotein YmbA